MRENNPSNFERTVLPHLDAAYGLARRLMRNQQDAEDMVQEAYLRAFTYFASFHGSDARAWVLMIVRNTCFSRLRSNRVLPYSTEFNENLPVPDPGAPNPEDLALLKHSDNVVRKAIEKLPDSLRTVLILREIDGMSYKEIADSTGMPAGTVMSSLSRARTRLRRGLIGVSSRHPTRDFATSRGRQRMTGSVAMTAVRN
jgi:RNA polymerase sigma-70 factor, ECF subfamily